MTDALPLLLMPPFVQVTEPNNLLDSVITDFQNGVVARGQITVNQPGFEHTCIIGGGSSTDTTCSCTPAATCSQEATCFGALCDYSKVSLAPSTVYKVGACGLNEHRGMVESNSWSHVAHVYEQQQLCQLWTKSKVVRCYVNCIVFRVLH